MRAERVETLNLLIRSQTLYPIWATGAYGAEAGRPRTGASPTASILSPVRLPVPPPRMSYWKLERKTGFNPATPTLARLYSTTELLPQDMYGYLIKSAGEGSRTPTPKAPDPSLVRLPIPPHPHINVF